MNNARTSALITIAIIAIAVAYSAVYLLMPPANRYDSLAKCLAEEGTIMYGSDTCHACAYQKELLGGSFKYVNYVDCAQQYHVCVSQRIGSLPTWLINGTFHVGVQAPENLSALSGCAI